MRPNDRQVWGRWDVNRRERKPSYFASVFSIKPNDLKTGKGRTNMIKRELKSKIGEVTVQSGSK